MAKQLDDICPLCNCTTDTGGECNGCDFDWQSDNRTEKQKHIDEANRLMAHGSKEELADFLRHNVYGSAVNYFPYS